MESPLFLGLIGGQFLAGLWADASRKLLASGCPLGAQPFPGRAARGSSGAPCPISASLPFLPIVAPGSSLEPGTGVLASREILLHFR